MKIQALILAILISFTSFSFVPSAAAQQDIGGIIDEIFGGQRRAPNGPMPLPRGPAPQNGQQSIIDNIPVEIRFETQGQPLPEDAMLIVTAYAPPPPNVRRSSPLMLGQTRILLSSLRSPLNIVIAAPGKITRDIDYARLEAKIVDHNGNALYELKNSGEFRGYNAPVLVLERFGSAAPTPAPSPNGFKSETISGSVSINGQAPQFTGSNLIVRLMEDGLAGGTSRVIVGETRKVLDGQNVPFDFSLTRTVSPNTVNTPLAFEVWIEDWAGRKTHVTPAPIPFNGAATNYRFRLDAITSTPPTSGSTPQILSARAVKGSARFNAFKGLPRGSMLTVELERFQNTSRPSQIAKTLVSLDGLSGDIPFSLDVPSTAFDPQLPNPVLRIRIEDKNGKLFFSNPGGTPYINGFNSIELRAAAGY